MKSITGPPAESTDSLFEEGEIEDLLEDFFCKEEVKCECGSEKCGSPKHSGWCPKWEEN